jgi:hypothetical protein
MNMSGVAGVKTFCRFLFPDIELAVEIDNFRYFFF